MKACSFIGHKDCPSEIRKSLTDIIENLILDEEVHYFFVGTQGGFDKLAYEVLCQLENTYKIQIVVVLAYLNRTPKNPYYDIEKTIFPDEVTKVPLRFAIRRRNRYMIDRSEYVVSYLNTPFSNTYGNVEEAVKKKKRVINLGSFDLNAWRVEHTTPDKI